MRSLSFVFIFLSVFSSGSAQNAVNILFIGNSFTYGNNMPQMFRAFADSAQIPVTIGVHAPGGISVGDIAQGTMAHMNNPVLFSLIRSKPWDYVVIQDNQGRFVRDSAQFPSSSLVVEGHLRLMDSVKASNACAKIILFGGWAFKNGSPPYGNTGIEMIRRILCNYRVLNDTMQEVIAPIGEAWIRVVNQQPLLNLWDTDDAHPSYLGSYLTASVIFSTIFMLPAAPNAYNAGLPLATAYNLRAYGDSCLFNSSNHARYNLCGAKQITPQAINNQVFVNGSFATYRWYQAGGFVSTATVLSTPPDGAYSVWLREHDSCLVKSCVFNFSAQQTTGITEWEKAGEILVYPNPSSGGSFTVRSSRGIEKVDLYDLRGIRQQVTVVGSGPELRVFGKSLPRGSYLLLVTTQHGVYRRTVLLEE